MADGGGALSDAAFAELLLADQAAVRRGVAAAIRLCPWVLDHHERDDLVQGAILRLWARRSSYDPAKGAFASFAYVVAYRWAVGVARDPEELAGNDYGALVSAGASDAQVWSEFGDWLKSLSEAERFLWLAFQLLDSDQKRVFAELHGATANALEVRVSKLNQDLKHKLRGDDKS